jgi:hypothetical protein
MATAEAPPATGADPLPKAVDLGDGTLVLRDQGEIRLSANRQRWWNGRAWMLVTECMPPNARLDEKGERWWDGVEWRPRTATLAPWERRPLLAGLTATWLLWVVLMAAGALPAVIGLILIVVTSLPGAVLTLRSRVLRSGEKGWYLLSVLGLAVLWFQTRRGGGEARAVSDGGAHLQV